MKRWFDQTELYYAPKYSIYRDFWPLNFEQARKERDTDVGVKKSWRRLLEKQMANGIASFNHKRFPQTHKAK